MGHWLASRRSVQAAGHLTRFDPRFWTVDFPRPMMASVVTTAPDALRVDAVFYRAGDLAGLIWDSVDRWDHVLTAYETDRDYRGCVLSFRWRSGGVLTLDAINGPTLTIEGRDAGGNPRAWYVRLWNHASGTPEDARVTLDFDVLTGGFQLPDEADPVYAGDIDRMFVSLVPPAYVEGSEAAIAPAEGWVELTDISCTGARSVLTVGECVVPEHGVRIATGYDDSYNLTPERMMRNIELLGYRGVINHYVGMSHYFRLEHASGGLFASLAGGVLNRPCAAWHRDFAERAAASGRGIIWSLSYELFDAHCWGDWKQRAADGSSALTGWEPPSALLSPANAGAMGYLAQVAQAFAAIAVAAGLAMRFQVGEPWWWVRADGTPCLYDAAAVAAFGGDPPVIASLKAPLSAEQVALLDQAGAMLAASTAALCEAVRAVAPGAETLLLAYLPTILDATMPEAKRANLPIGWAKPAFDVLQLEDYDWAATGNERASARGVALAELRLNYPVDQQHYLAGFVLRPDQREQWHAIAHAARVGRRRGVAETFYWALPQVLRDGFVHFDEEDETVQAFDDVLFPLALGAEAEVAPETATAILTASGGHERRNVGWAEPRTRYDVGPGVRSEADIAELLAFFRARMGPARGFRLRDPFDHAGTDEAIGTGDGHTMRFALTKGYGEMRRRITRPVAGSVRVAVDGVETQAFSLDPGGLVTFDVPPGAGAAITASFEFDVAVRFAEDRLSVSRATFMAGEAPSVPLIELREA
ncbi:TIGR02217 family protein [Sphingomonas sp. IW22]|uniref:phage distal tail protein, Rcc01695 family n=1 Tax=Sphingomonas sp. IW22 TaxID=3242489 RepID=UPI0035228BA2